jgi:hypothetical protein
MTLRRLPPSRLPILVLPLYLVASALQTSCSGAIAPSQASRGDAALDGDDLGAGDDETSDASTIDGGSCPPGESPREVASTPVCCVAQSSSTFACHRRNTASLVAGGGCSSQGATAPGDEIDVQTDVCVTETCAGDRSCQPYDAVAEERRGTLVCSGQQGLHWAWQTVDSDHRVERACLPSGVQYCVGGSPGGSYGDYEPYAPAYSSAPEYACGYDEGGYGGIPRVTLRELVLLGSTCATDAGRAPCPPGNL